MYYFQLYFLSYPKTANKSPYKSGKEPIRDIIQENLKSNKNGISQKQREAAWKFLLLNKYEILAERSDFFHAQSQFLLTYDNSNKKIPRYERTKLRLSAGGRGGELPWKQRPCLHFSLPILRPPWSELSVRSSISNSFGRTKRWNLWNFFASRIFFDSLPPPPPTCLPLAFTTASFNIHSRFLSLVRFYLAAFPRTPPFHPPTHPPTQKRYLFLDTGTYNEKFPLYIPYI